ncbi:MAG: histidinol-phosphatase [Oscillospiraceae bacterium]|nr:histidinol-phosphatase [Oscillospiraceae bacterium]
MIVNYHSHTPRCGHAEGSEREYVEAALRAGLVTLGFSDHTPWDYFDRPYRNERVRMAPEELPSYADTVRALAEEYRGRIEILLGVEAEYYPKYFPRLLELLRQNGIGYMILGQHFYGNELGEPPCGRPTDDPARLAGYVDQTIEALQTGLFSYFAHPDLIRFTGDDGEYSRQMRRLCRAARELDTPLEINLLGIREGRNYPDERFWRIAAEEGNAVVIGCDAHRPGDILDFESEKAALKLVEKYGLDLRARIPLREI